MNKKIFAIALISLITNVRAMEMQQTVIKQLPKVKVKVNNKTDKNYFITTSQKFDWPTFTIVPTDQNSNPSNSAVKAEGSAELTVTLHEHNPENFIEGFHRYSRDLFITNGQDENLSLEIIQDAHDNDLWAKLRTQLWEFTDQKNPYHIESDELQNNFSEGSKREIVFYVTINLNKEGSRKTTMDISAISN